MTDVLTWLMAITVSALVLGHSMPRILFRASRRERSHAHVRCCRWHGLPEQPMDFRLAIRAGERGGMSQFSRILRYSKYRPMDCLCGMRWPDLNSKLSVSHLRRSSALNAARDLVNTKT